MANVAILNSAAAEIPKAKKVVLIGGKEGCSSERTSRSADFVCKPNKNTSYS